MSKTASTLDDLKFVNVAQKAVAECALKLQDNLDSDYVTEEYLERFFLCPKARAAASLCEMLAPDGTDGEDLVAQGIAVGFMWSVGKRGKWDEFMKTNAHRLSEEDVDNG